MNMSEAEEYLLQAQAIADNVFGTAATAEHVAVAVTLLLHEETVQRPGASRVPPSGLRPDGLGAAPIEPPGRRNG